MGNLKRIAKLERVIGSERKMSWKEFITSDTWPGGVVPDAARAAEDQGKPITPSEKAAGVTRIVEVF